MMNHTGGHKVSMLLFQSKRVWIYPVVNPQTAPKCVCVTLLVVAWYLTGVSRLLDMGWQKDSTSYFILIFNQLITCDLEWRSIFL